MASARIHRSFEGAVTVRRVRDLLGLLILVCCWTGAAAQPAAAPAPMLASGHPVQWWAALKLNTATSPTDANDSRRACPFGGTLQQYKRGFSQDYVVARADNPSLSRGTALIGVGGDPLSATFAQLYTGNLSYVVWNDQFYQDPKIPGCGDDCKPPSGHSKGFLAWDDSGAGFIVQVSTPSWPGSGSAAHPRGDGNTLGCVTDNDVLVSQHFFALQLSAADMAKVLDALWNEAAITLAGSLQVMRVSDGSPSAIRTAAAKLGNKTPPAGASLKRYMLDSGVVLFSKPGSLAVPPWQAVSASLGGEPLRVASWWTGTGGLPSTRAVKPACWSDDLGTPGEVDVAVTGTLGPALAAPDSSGAAGASGQAIGLAGGSVPNGNHAKIGVSLAGNRHLTIFGDMNEDGRLQQDCAKEQNARGGLFFVLDDAALWTAMSGLLAGQTAAYGDRTVAEGAAHWSASTPSARRHRRSRTP